MLTTVFCVPQSTKTAYASTGLSNPLTGYSTTAGFETISGGSYSSTNPYKIESAGDLIKLAYYVNVAKDQNYATASYQMDNHIDLSKYNWQPIGNTQMPFSGIFNGNGYSIYGLTITSDTTLTDAGLFGYVSAMTYSTVTYEPVIKLLGIKDASVVNNASYVGSIAGRVVGNGGDIDYTDIVNVSASAVIQECYAVSFVSGSGIIGGLVGELSSGACICNCYTAPSANNRKEVDILGTSPSGSVGGIVGKVSNPSDSANAVHYTYTMSAVAKLATLSNTTNVGGVIGDVSAITVSEYSSNIYYEANAPANKGSTAGRNWGIGYFSQPTRFTNFGWSLDAVEDGKWTKYERGETPAHIWKLSSEVNNKYPVLTRVPQLAKVTLDASLDGNPVKTDFVDYYFNGYKDMANPDVTDFIISKPIIIDKHNFYIEQGQTFNAYAEYIETKANPTYEFDTWYRVSNASTVVTNPTEVALDKVTHNMNPLARALVGADSVYTAKFIYKLYNMSASANSASFGNVKVKIATSGDENSVNWDSIAYTTNSSSIRIGTIVRIEATPTSGYRVNYWQVNGAAIMVGGAPFADNVYVFTMDGERVIVTDFGLKTYNFTIRAQDGQGGVANLSYTINDGPKQTASSISNMEYGSVVKLIAENVDSNYEFSYWSIKADGLTEYNLAIGADQFKIEDYNNYVVTAHFEKVKFLVNISVNILGVADVAFGTGETTSRNVAYDEQWSVKVSNIKTGYHFERWDIVDNDGINPYESMDMTSPTLAISGISKNLTCTAVFALNMCTVTLESAGEHAEYAHGMTATQYTNIEYGDRFEVTINVDNGYFLKNWVDGQGNILGVLDTLNIVVTANITIRPNVNIEQHSVLIYSEWVADENTSMSIGNDCYIQYYGADWDEDKVANGKFDKFTDMSFKVVVPAGLVFVEYKMVSEGLTDVIDYQFFANGTGKINAIKKDLNIICYFARMDVTVNFEVKNDTQANYYYTLGALTDSYKNNNSVETKAGELLTLQSSPTGVSSKQYKFGYWMIDGKPYSNSQQVDLVLYQDITVQAVYELAKFSLTINQDLPGGNITGFDAGTYKYGDIVNLQTTVLPGYRFVGWYDIYGGGELSLGSDKTLNYKIERNTILKAKYKKLGAVYVVLSDKDAGAVQGAGNYDIGQNINLNVYVNPGYEFLYWTVDGEIVGTENTLSITVAQDVNVIDVVFGALQSISVKSNNLRWGIVKGVPSAKLGEQVTIRAIPAENCAFEGWFIDDNLVSTDANYSFVVNGSLSLEAKFGEAFNFMTLWVIIGCVILAILIIVLVVYFVRQNEKKKLSDSKTGNDRWQIYGVDNGDKHNNSSHMSCIMSIPVRTVTVPPRDYKGNIKTVKYDAVAVEEVKRGRGRPKGSLNKKGRKTLAPMYPGQKGRPKGSLNKKGRKVYELKAPGKRGRPLGSKNKPK